MTPHAPHAEHADNVYRLKPVEPDENNPAFWWGEHSEGHMPSHDDEEMLKELMQCVLEHGTYKLSAWSNMVCSMLLQGQLVEDAGRPSEDGA